MGDVATTAPHLSPTAKPVEIPRTSWLTRLYWLWPALLTLGFGLWRIGTPGLWADELATWGAVRLDWHALRQLLGNVDATVAPYYAVMKVWTGVVGTGTIALRLPTVLAMVGAAALVSVLGTRLSGGRVRVGLIAGLLFAVLPTTSRYAQEARPYGFVVFFAVLATLLFTWLIEKPRVGIALGYAGAVLLLGAFHLIALLLLVVHGLAVATTRDRRTIVTWVLAIVGPLLLLTPMAVLGHRQLSQISWIGPADWRTLAASPETIIGAGSAAGALAMLCLLAVRRRRAELLLAGWVLVPPVVLYLAAKATPIFWPRYLIFTMPAWALLAAFGLGAISLRRAAAAITVIAVLAAPSQYAIRTGDGHNHATRAAGYIIASHYQPGDGLVVALHEQPEPWEARDIVARYVPANRTPTDIFAVTPQRAGGQLIATECPDLAACLAATNPPRLWVIRFESQPDPLSGIGQPKEALLRAHYKTQQIWLVRGLTVALLVRS